MPGRGTPELRGFIKDFFAAKAGRVFDWEAMPRRWQQAQIALSMEWQKQHEKTQELIAQRLEDLIKKL